jgi:hypothetical protein
MVCSPYPEVPWGKRIDIIYHPLLADLAPLSEHHSCNSTCRWRQSDEVAMCRQQSNYNLTNSVIACDIDMPRTFNLRGAIILKHDQLIYGFGEQLKVPDTRWVGLTTFDWVAYPTAEGIVLKYGCEKRLLREWNRNHLNLARWHLASCPAPKVKRSALWTKDLAALVRRHFSALGLTDAYLRNRYL